jgi:hypothetical protein
LKATIERQGLTAYRVAKLAGVQPSVLHRFLDDGPNHRDLRLATADKIAVALGLALVEQKPV